MADSDPKEPSKQRHRTMQVNVDDLYAELEGANLSAPPPLPSQPPSQPPASGSPSGAPRISGSPQSQEDDSGSSARIWGIGVLVVAIAAGAAYGLSQIVFADDPPPPRETSMEVGPIEMD